MTSKLLLGFATGALRAAVWPLTFLVVAALGMSAPDTARLVNISTRTQVGGAAGTPIAGFVITGTGTRDMLVRAVGPGLSGFGVPSFLPDPGLALVSNSEVLASNADWLAGDGPTMSALGAFTLAPGSMDAAFVASLIPGVYSSLVTAPAASNGVVLLEAYDGSSHTTSSVVNVSTRALVGTGDSVLITGFVISGTGSLSLLIRAVGPTLASYGVPNVLSDPTLTLYQNGTALASNDNWSSATNAAEISSMAAAVGAFALPADSKDAALVTTLPSGVYSAVVSGLADTVGTALVELYSHGTAPPNDNGLAIAETAQYPDIPTYLDSVWVTARVNAGPGTTVSQMMLSYRTASAEGTLPMLDDGSHGDGTADDGIFGAAIPAQPGGTAMSYNIVATGNNGETATSAPASYQVAGALTDAIFTAPEFLGIPTDHSVVLNLAASTPLELYVDYGPASGAYVGHTPVVTYQPGPPFELTVQSADPLAPFHANERIYYRVRYRTPGEAVFRSRGERSFQTQRPRGVSFTLTVTADPHLDDMTSAGLFTVAMENIRTDRADFHIDLGDILMSDKLSQIIPGLSVNYGLIEYRATTLRNLFAGFCHSAPFFFTLGNHEGEYGYIYNADATAGKDSNIASWDLRARKLYFPTPVPSEFYTGNTGTKLIGGRSELLEDYYAWEWGDALFVVLDPFWNTLSNPNANPADNWRWSLGKAQYDWLQQTLQKSQARYKFVFIHHLVGGVASARGGVETALRYEWGGQNADGTDGFAAHRPGWSQPIHQLLLANRVSAVFHGHDHFYAYQQLDGIVYQECPQPGAPNFSTGSQSDGQYTTGTIRPNSGHLRITVSTANTKVEYVRAALPSQETTNLHNRDIAHTYTIAPSN